MPLHLERVDWMPSPPLVPDNDGPIDLDHLRRMTLGDASLENDVLEMFASQAASLLKRLAGRPADAALLAHTLKGSARAIGASEVAEAADDLERIARHGGEVRAALNTLVAAVAQARAAIDELLRRS